MLSDQKFFNFSRTENPGASTGIAYHDHSDMAGNLLLLYALTIGYKAHRVLEIGTADGTSTLAFLKAMSEIGGCVISVDQQNCECAHALVEQYGFEHLWQFRRGDSHVLLKDLLQERAEFDLILIDGDHSWQGAKQDIIDSSALLKPDGLLLIHDCYFAREGDGEGTAKTILEFLKESEWQGIVLPFAGNMGLFQRRQLVQTQIEAVLRVSGF